MKLPFVRFSLIPTVGERSWPNEPTVELCVDECGSKCCRTPSFYLPLKPHEEALFEGYPIRNEVTIRDEKLGSKLRGRFISFQDTGGRCPHLDFAGMCTIYEDRPDCCVQTAKSSSTQPMKRLPRRSAATAASKVNALPTHSTTK